MCRQVIDSQNFTRDSGFQLTKWQDGPQTKTLHPLMHTARKRGLQCVNKVREDFKPGTETRCPRGFFHDNILKA